MKLSKAQKNVLEAIKDQTIILRGKNKGQIKKRISCFCYYQNTINALHRRGLISYGEGVKGSGYAATKKSLNY